MLEVQTVARAYDVEIEDAFLHRQFELTEPMGLQAIQFDRFSCRKTSGSGCDMGEPLRRGKGKSLAMPETERLLRELRQATL